MTENDRGSHHNQLRWENWVQGKVARMNTTEGVTERLRVYMEEEL